jgi:hypothetical protein
MTAHTFITFVSIFAVPLSPSYVLFPNRGINHYNHNYKAIEVKRIMTSEAAPMETTTATAEGKQKSRRGHRHLSV